MAHVIEWDNKDKTVILQQYHAPASKTDLYELAAKSAAMLNSVSHTVHLIIDERAIKLQLTKEDLTFLERLVPMNQGFVVMVMPRFDVSYKMKAQRLGHFVAPRAVNNTHFTSSIEEARDLLREKASVFYP